MACGTPVIAFDRGSMPELVADGITGMIVDDVDAAVVAVDRVGSSTVASIRAVAVERFGVDRMVDEYVEVYEKVVADARR